MLVLSRKRGESLVINGGPSKVTVIDIRGDKVRLGIDAEREVTVHRKEIADRIEAERIRRQSARTSAGHREPESTA